MSRTIFLCSRKQCVAAQMSNSVDAKYNPTSFASMEELKIWEAQPDAEVEPSFAVRLLDGWREVRAKLSHEGDKCFNAKFRELCTKILNEVCESADTTLTAAGFPRSTDTPRTI